MLQAAIARGTIKELELAITKAKAENANPDINVMKDCRAAFEKAKAKKVTSTKQLQSAVAAGCAKKIGTAIAIAQVSEVEAEELTCAAAALKSVKARDAMLRA